MMCGYKVAVIALALVCAAAGRAAAESYTLTTYYPSPAGVYTNMTVTSTTVLAAKGGNVGIGVAAPSEKLEVAGTVKAAALKIPTGAEAGKVLTSDARGAATWQPAGGGVPVYFPNPVLCVTPTGRPMSPTREGCAYPGGVPETAKGVILYSDIGPCGTSKRVSGFPVLLQYAGVGVFVLPYSTSRTIVVQRSQSAEDRPPTYTAFGCWSGNEGLPAYSNLYTIGYIK